VKTGVRAAALRDRALAFVHEKCTEGRQAYVVLPVIEESERADLRAATIEAERLHARWPDLSVGLVHGKLKPAERDETMRRFRAGEIQVLVATTVIEVGIDVPNATVMLIEHPERFGLAQLHQLRGRIGRGAEESFCILVAEESAPPRLKAFAATNDGFKIAELDLLERKMGDLIGERQAGDFELRLARLPEDTELLAQARGVAQEILDQDPLLLRPRHLPLKQRALGRYPRAVELFRTG
ncbi:MAG: helicase-related protein, partial [Gemmatimonadota bacterium]